MSDMAKQAIKELSTIGIRLPADLKEWVEKQAERRLLSISDIVREAILEKKERVDGRV